MNSNRIKELFERSAMSGGGQYEQTRWFKDEIKKSGYEMTGKTIKEHFLSDLAPFGDYLELGPGSGTWTKLFLEKCPDAEFDLVDISGEMLKQARADLGEADNIRYFCSDFLEFQPDKQYDIFFSSRALEYIVDKEEAVKKIVGLLKPNGRGFIITKTPKYLRARLLGRNVPELHAGQISSQNLMVLLRKAGLKDIEIYPATMSFPLLKSPRLNLLLFKVFYGYRLNFLSQFFSESYCVKFAKK
jgi:ubiquinone/menaquinone biosynthesis C-methylase UbiE